MGSRIFLAAFALAVMAACAFHAAITVLFVLPPNPIGESVRPLVLAYTHPVFEQYWNVFAPTPIDSDVSVFARVKPRGAPDSAAGPWFDVSKTLIDEDKKSPLSQYSTLKIVQMTVAVAAKNDKVLGRRTLTRSEAGAIRDPRHRPMILDAMRRLALTVGAGSLSSGRREVQLALADHKFPRFTHRFERDDKSKNTTTLVYPWLPADEERAR
jgi:hypothetical protein